jgi:hypothetical protein
MNRVFPFRKQCRTSGSMIRRKEVHITDKSRLAAQANSFSAGMVDAMRARAMQLRAATLVAATFVAVALLAGTSDAARKKQPIGSRQFSTQTSCGTGNGGLVWAEDHLSVSGLVSDGKDHPNSKTHLYVNWTDEKGKNRRWQIKGATAHNGEIDKPFGMQKFGQQPVTVPSVQGTPRDAEVTACSDSCGKRWACGRPG